MAQLLLLFSPPGTGKTSFCIDLFREEIQKSSKGLKSRAYFILPSREHADRIQALLLRKEAGVFNAHLLTINDLAMQFMGEAGETVPNDSLRLRALEETLKEGGFEYFKEVKDFAGFQELLLETVKEFGSNLLSVRDFEKACQPLLKDGVFRQKFKDFTVLTKQYHQKIKKLGFQEIEEKIEHLFQNRARLPKGGVFILDGFYHFTKAQLRLIEALALNAKQVIVTLSLDDDKKRPGVFDYALQTKKELLALGFRASSRNFSKNHRVENPDLSHAAAEVFSLKPKVFRTKVENIQLFEAPNARMELEMIAREIRRLYRTQNIHFSDVAVFFRKVSGSESLVQSVFERYSIPYFLHERKKLIEHGPSQILYRFLKLLTGDWQREDVLFVLKNAHFGEKYGFEALHELEVHLWSKNIRGGREAFISLAVDESLSETARSFVRFLTENEQKLKKTAEPRAFKAQMLRLFDEFGTTEADRKAREAVTKILDETVLLKPEEFAPEFLKLLEKGLYSYKPGGKNRIQIYDVVMAMPKEYKVVFMAGMVEKIFPQSSIEDALFKDHERRSMNQEAGRTVLDEQSRRKSGERYFFYMGLTRARQKLYLTYPLYDDEGKALLPSFFVQELKKCFESLPVRQKNLQDFVPAEQEMELEEDLKNAFALSGSGRLFEEIAGFRDHQPRPQLQDKRIQEILAKRSHFSATKLETYATCAFKYFCNRELGLQEYFENEHALEMGRILHAVLENFFKLNALAEPSREFWKDEAGLWNVLTGLLSREMGDETFGNEPLYRKRLYFNRMKRVLRSFLAREKDLNAKRSFRPKYFEMEFNDFMIHGDSGPIHLKGFIDRVDVTADGSQALVVDYKLSKRPQTIEAKFKKGLEIQLPLYAMVLREKLNLQIAGMELRLLQNQKEEGIYLESARTELGFARKKMIGAEEFDDMLAETKARIREYVKRLRQSDISIKSKSCDYCQYDSVCRFEKWKLIYEK